jgi:hypothetical protein
VPNFDNLLILYRNCRFFAKVTSEKFIFYQLTSNQDALKIMKLHPNTIIDWYYMMYEPSNEKKDNEGDLDCVIL